MIPSTSGGRAAEGDRSHIELTCLMNVYFNQGDTSVLTSLMETYAKLPAAILDVTQFLIVDDGSPTPVRLPEHLNLNLLILRIHDDIPWNQPGARNLGVVYARSEKVLMTDVDHTFTPEVFLHALHARPPRRTVFKMKRIHPDGRSCRPHPNTFFLARSRFLALYGYDEAYSGHYGFDDSMFWRWQRNHGTRFRYLPSRCRVIKRDFEKDGRYHSFERDLSHNREIAEANRAAWKQWGPARGHSRRFLNFTWSIQEDRVRDTQFPAPPARPLWTRTWWLRWIKPCG